MQTLGTRRSVKEIVSFSWTVYIILMSYACSLHISACFKKITVNMSVLGKQLLLIYGGLRAAPLTPTYLRKQLSRSS